MSSTAQIVLDKDRERQWSKIIAKRPDLADLGFTDAARKLFFTTMDSIVPLPKEGEE